MTANNANPTPEPSPVWTAETYSVCLRSGEMGWCVKGADDTVCDVYTNDPRRISELIAEAGNVYHETGLTPRQLAQQRAKLLAALTKCAFTPCGREANSYAGKIARAAIARCKETTS